RFGCRSSSATASSTRWTTACAAARSSAAIWAASSSTLAKAVRNHLTRIVLPLPGQPRDFIVTREVARIGLGQGRFDLGNLPLVVLDELPNGFRGEEGLAALGGRREAVEAILHLVIEADG